MTTGWPRALAHSSEIRRAAISALPPGAYGTISLTGFSGKDWARQAVGKTNAMPISIWRNGVILRIVCLLELFCMWFCRIRVCLTRKPILICLVADIMSTYSIYYFLWRYN